MPAYFDGSSGQRLRTINLPTITPPCSFGWAMRWSTNGTSRLVFSAAETASDNYGWIVFKNTSNLLGIGAWDTGNYNESVTGTAITSNEWEYVVARFFSATNRRLSVRHANGAVEHVQNTTNIASGTKTAYGVGYAGANPDVDVPLGAIAHLWFARSDLQMDSGGVLDDSFMHILHDGGPLALSHLANDPTLEYTAMIDSIDGSMGDGLYKLGRNEWVNHSGVYLVS